MVWLCLSSTKFCSGYFRRLIRLPPECCTIEMLVLFPGFASRSICTWCR